MDQFEVMRELFTDRSSWADIRHYPDTVTCRRMLRLADFAAADPARWSSCRMAFEVPELSRPELAVARGVSVRTLQRHLAQQDLSDAGDFTESELDGERPEWLRAVSIRFDVGRVSRTWRYATALCTFAAAQPDRWRVIRLAYECPELSQAELAKLCGVSQQSVSNYLQPVRLEVDESFNDLEVIY
ncbi:winged helix-turn-helix domain-containing protein [uncultured Victivallis sp.]|mgnify:CR=1 FL=1|uniref:winged helix-turn-helix domain-containing protein n=1 Tax=uncultured Victivallis sp. TaxID=354118 RepID=UPI00259817DB|nr:winged helix-turn-helix domain-containing protein [uncultured Victivallis sp.]